MRDKGERREKRKKKGGFSFDLLRCDRQRLGTCLWACCRKSASGGNGLSISSLSALVSSVAKLTPPFFIPLPLYTFPLLTPTYYHTITTTTLLLLRLRELLSNKNYLLTTILLPRNEQAKKGETSLAYDESTKTTYLLKLLLLKTSATLTQLIPPKERNN